MSVDSKLLKDRSFWVRFGFACSFAFSVLAIISLFFSFKKMAIDQLSSAVEARLSIGDFRSAIALLDGEMGSFAQKIILREKGREPFYRRGENGLLSWRQVVMVGQNYMLEFTISSNLIWPPLTLSGFFHLLFYRARRRQHLELLQQNQISNREAMRAKNAELVRHDMMAPLAYLLKRFQNHEEPLVRSSIDRLSRLGGAPSVEMRRINVFELLSSNLLLLRERFPEKHFFLENAERSLHSFGLPADIERGLLNVSLNAAEAAKSRVSLSIFSENLSTRIIIQDDGFGFSGVEKIQEKKFKIPSTKHSGFGMGLSQAAEAFEKSGWFFEIKNTSDGCRQELTIPRHAILIDNDKDVVEMWSLAALRAGINFLSFDGLGDFWSAKIDHKTPIFIDENRGLSEPGHFLAKLMADRGYRCLFITTGNSFSEQDLSKWPWIRGVVGKVPPWIAG